MSYFSQRHFISLDEVMVLSIAFIIKMETSQIRTGKIEQVLEALSAEHGIFIILYKRIYIDIYEDIVDRVKDVPSLFEFKESLESTLKLVRKKIRQRTLIRDTIVESERHLWRIEYSFISRTSHHF